MTNDEKKQRATQLVYDMLEYANGMEFGYTVSLINGDIFVETEGGTVVIKAVWVEHL